MQTVLMVFSQRLLHSFVHQRPNVYCFKSFDVFEGVPKFKKSRSRDLAHDHVDLILHLSLVYPVSNLMPNLKFLALTVPEIWRGFQNYKSRSRDPLSTPFDLILHYFVRSPSGQSVCQI